MVLDPSGLRWLRQTAFAVDRGAAFYNSAPIPYDVAFVASRLFAIGLPLVAVLATIRRDRRGDRTRHRAKPRAAGKPQTVAVPPPLASLGMTASRPSALASVGVIVRSELSALVRQPAVALFGVLLLALIGEAAASAEVEGARVLLTTGVLAVSALEVVTFLLALVLLFVLVEAVHRDRATGFDAVLYATQVRTGALLAGKTLAALALMALLMMASALMALLLVALLGDGRVDVLPLVVTWGGIAGSSLVLWGAFSLVLAVTFGRAAAYALGLTALGGTLFAALSGALTWATNWPVAGALRWSDFGLFELDWTPLLLNRALVLCAAVALGLAAWRLFERTERDPSRRLDRLGVRSLLHTFGPALPFAAAALVLAGILTTRIDAGYQGDVARGWADTYWRSNAAEWSGAPAPSRTHVDLRIRLVPDRHQVQIDGTYTLVNPTNQPMERVPFTVRPALGDVAWRVGGEVVDAEVESGLHVLPLALAPGDTLDVGFSFVGTYPDGFSRDGGGAEQFVLPSGVLLHTLRDDFLPSPGFLDALGPAGALPRRLLPGSPLPPAVGDATLFTTRVEVTAPRALTVNGVGEKTDEREAGDERTVVWESRTPVSALNVVAARYAVRRSQGAALFFHPDHEANVDTMLHTLSAARRHFGAWFAPYPWEELRLSAFPDHARLAQGFPSNIVFSEGIGFLVRNEGEAPLPVVVTAHEAAHQWFGNRLLPADAPGADFLIEGLAQYATARLLEAEQGNAARQSFLRDREADYVP